MKPEEITAKVEAPEAPKSNTTTDTEDFYITD